MRRWRRGAAVALAALASVAVFDLGADRRAAAIVVHDLEPTASARHQPGIPDEPFFVLLIGSDEREGLDGARGDALHIVGLNPAEGKASIVNIPRDTYVPIPGHGTQRINEALDEGGVDLQVETVERFSGVPIRYAITTTFDGLARMVDAFGGLEVDVPYRMDDRNSGAVYDAGRQVLDGPQVLGFARNRHVPGGDFTRTAHQAQIIIHALEALRERGTSGTDTIRYLDVLLRNIRTKDVSVSELYHIGRAALAVDAADVRSVTIPAREGMAGQAAVVFAQPGASALFADLADDAILQSH